MDGRHGVVQAEVEPRRGLEAEHVRVRAYVFDPLEYEALGLAPWNAQVLFYGAAAAPAFALAWLSWRVFEAPILRLKARFPYSRASAA